MIRIDNEYADIWLIYEEKEGANYCYGGTRSVSWDATDLKAEHTLNYLGLYESGVKNTLINSAVENGKFNLFDKKMPKAFYKSRVSGGRCVFRPKSKEIEEIVKNPANIKFQLVIDSILNDIGKKLNYLNGKLKLTPDFGRFSGVADMLHKYTENVLGIRCEEGGCGGKASYTSTGINAAIDYFLEKHGKTASIILIGSNGACGEGVFQYLLENKKNLVGVSDLEYHEDKVYGIPVLKSEAGKFTYDCLSAADIVVATTVGEEFINSDTDCIKDGATVLLAHNDCLPINEKSVNLLIRLKERGIIVIPGQMLTFGGALTSRIEWFWRQENKNQYFDKKMAHRAVYHMMKYVMEQYYGNHFCGIPFEKIVKQEL